jgi:hypothetical protein
MTTKDINKIALVLANEIHYFGNQSNIVESVDDNLNALRNSTMAIIRELQLIKSLKQSRKVLIDDIGQIVLEDITNA